MTIEAEQARAAAVHFEGKKHALAQMQNGDWKVTFTVSQEDMPQSLSADPMGQRYIIAVCAKNDDETPRLPVKKEKKSFDELPSSQQAALLCNDERFIDYLESEGLIKDRTKEDVVYFVRKHCNVSSRADLDWNGLANDAFEELKSNYRDYQTTQRYGDYV